MATLRRGDNEFGIPAGGVEDMITLMQLSEEALLFNLQERYDRSLIYVPLGEPEGRCLMDSSVSWYTEHRPTQALFLCP